MLLTSLIFIIKCRTGGIIDMEQNYFRVVCVDEGNPFGYMVLEDTNKGSLTEVHKFIDENYYKHIGNGIKWILLPATTII